MMRLKKFNNQWFKIILINNLIIKIPKNKLAKFQTNNKNKNRFIMSKIEFKLSKILKLSSKLARI